MTNPCLQTIRAGIESGQTQDPMRLNLKIYRIRFKVCPSGWVQVQSRSNTTMAQIKWNSPCNISMLLGNTHGTDPMLVQYIWVRVLVLMFTFQPGSEVQLGSNWTWPKHNLLEPTKTISHMKKWCIIPYLYSGVNHSFDQRAGFQWKSLVTIMSRLT